MKELPNMNRILVCGHRGEKIHGNENTMTAFRAALSAGVDMLETDVHMTRDRQLVLMHDAEAARTTDGTGLISEMTLDEVLCLNAAVHADPPTAPEPPATLRSLLELVRDYPEVLLNIELKDYPEETGEMFALTCADKTCELLIEYGVEERTYINSFSGRLLEYVYARYGRRFHYHGFYPWFILGKMHTDPESFIGVACMQHRYQTDAGEAVKYDDPMCPKEWFDHLLSVGIMPLMAPSLREYPLYDTAFSWGSRIVNADDPKKMLAHLREKGWHD